MNTISDPCKVTKWMIGFCTANESKRIASKAVAQFPLVFSENSKAFIPNGSTLWSMWDKMMSLKELGVQSKQFCFSSTQSCKQGNLKALQGHGCKRAEWVKMLYNDLRFKFERLRKVGVKFDTSLLHIHALMMIMNVEKGSEYHESIMHIGKLIANYVTRWWTQNFMYTSRSVLRAQAGNHLISQRKQTYTEKTVACSMGKLNRGFDSGELNDDLIENADETHCVINMNNGKTLRFIGDEHLKHMDVISGGDAMTIVIKVGGGRRASIQPPMVLFKNGNHSCPIHPVADDVSGLCYRTSAKGWMYSQVWPQRLSQQKPSQSSYGLSLKCLFC